MRRAGLLRLAVALATVPGLPSAVSSAAQPPTTKLEIAVSSHGFRPARLALRRGETVQVVLTAAEGEHCLALDALRIEKRVAAGKPTRFDLTPERAGVFPFYCCLETGAAAERERGELTVSD